MQQSFSRRFGLNESADGHLVQDDAPEELRTAVLALLYDEYKLTPSGVRALVCRVLRKRPDPSNWSEWPNIAGEVDDLVYSCAWNKVYDIAEAFYQEIAKRAIYDEREFQEDLNAEMFELGLGWKMVDGIMQIRGDESFELTLAKSRNALSGSRFQSARRELDEAVRDLSRRPVPDLTGALHHATAAIEAIAREATGSKETLGSLLKHHPGLLPTPISDALSKFYGHASDVGRHGSEGKTVDLAEVELTVAVCAAACSFLLAKLEP